MTDLAATVMGRCEALGRVSEEPDLLVRPFASEAMRHTNDLVADWMRAAGMTVRSDEIGNLIGRYEGKDEGGGTLVFGSHLDTVRDAGKYDGLLGVMVALACVERLHQRNERLPFALEVVGFADEAGHAGTVPMEGRRDALCAAAEFVLAVEETARSEPGMVATVGYITTHPGAGNVIPAETSLSLDLCHGDDPVRERSVQSLRERAEGIAAARGEEYRWQMRQESHAVPPTLGSPHCSRRRSRNSGTGLSTCRAGRATTQRRWPRSHRSRCCSCGASEA